jgi:peptidoglycan/LPS O-acetylase OafA/YrhL
MGYEVPYYLIFGLAHFTQGRWRWPLVALALLLAGPSIAASFPLWLLGVGVYRYSCQHSLGPRTGLFLFAGSLAVALAYELAAQHSGRLLIAGQPWLKRPEVLQDYIVGGCFAANLLGFHAAAQQLGRPLLRHAAAIRWAAGATFTLYLCHLPVAQFIASLVPWGVGDGRSRGVVFVGTLLGVALIARYTERRKHAWRGGFERVWPRALIV